MKYSESHSLKDHISKANWPAAQQTNFHVFIINIIMNIFIGNANNRPRHKRETIRMQRNSRLVRIVIISFQIALSILSNRCNGGCRSKWKSIGPTHTHTNLLIVVAAPDALIYYFLSMLSGPIRSIAAFTRVSIPIRCIRAHRSPLYKAWYLHPIANGALEQWMKHVAYELWAWVRNSSSRACNLSTFYGDLLMMMMGLVRMLCTYKELIIYVAAFLNLARNLVAIKDICRGGEANARCLLLAVIKNELSLADRCCCGGRGCQKGMQTCS